MIRRSGYRRLSRRPSGFSMIEVLVALVILAIGLLGFALLQTMNLRFTQSANYRTQATNLAYDLLDQMRANRFQAVWYGGASGASFGAGEIDDIEFATLRLRHRALCYHQHFGATRRADLNRFHHLGYCHYCS